jgi:hypothetical protein
MHAYSKWATMGLLAAGLAMGSVATYAAHDEGGESSGHSGGKGKGPKYMGGGDHGGSHSSSSHKGGSAHHDSSEGGSKALEDKIFHDGSVGNEPSRADAGYTIAE